MIINATSIGRNPSGIGRHSLSISLYFLEHWDYPFQLFINKHALVHFENAKNKDKIKVISGAVSPDFGFRGHFLRFLWANKLSLQNKKKLIFNTSPTEGSLFRCKQIITVYDIIPLLFSRNYKKQCFYYKYILSNILKNSVRILTVSENSKNSIINYYTIPKEKIDVIYCGIIEYFINPKINFTKQNYILYVGRLSPIKNIEGLVKSFDLLINKHKLDLRLKLTVKNGDLNLKINNETRRKIDFVGDVSEIELLDLYKNASLLVLPSFHEGFGLPPLEAAASGCPLVVSNVASLPEIYGDAAYYVDPYDAEHIAEGMYKVLTDNELRTKLIQNGFVRVKMYREEISAKKHIKIFEKVLNLS
ncbi:MAG: glycosyltransferase family 4 protein [Candidatus Scalindua sp.]|nr:glycosyltransferase family 4 protein [Candidatus Scalindua sp.]MCR4343856.1 glycosyltransferase family 4 protein [Candidatus Scalindua sp.]